jgi:uncharacterized repeat protein (TIGR01451 family)
VVSSNARTNTATITHSDQLDPSSANNSASATVTPQQADLALLQATSDPTPDMGEQVIFSLILFDSGPDAATNVTVTDPLPAGLTFVSANPSQGTYDATTGL